MQLPLAVLAAAFTQAALTTASSLTPPVLPLTVRNPYLSTWLGNAREAPWSKWPMFYTGEEIGLSLMAHVPSQGAVYPLVGKPQDSLPSGQVQFPEYLGNNYDASTTNFTYRIDTGSSTPLEITISFLSPITPTSTLRQSIPASYVTIDVRGDTNVNVYMDIDARWVTGDHGTKINWAWDTINVQDKTSKSPALQRWQIRREQELHLSEIRDRAEWGTLHFTGPAVSKAVSSISHPVSLT